ncbi:hypothetical protein OG607_19935 [Streptomyces sp. NBC_01537]|uniref:hypothetical protein n=1 Tax=Streptomyces sp. NBC_01537 TaxID=2903896 RepID=UPI0038690933
MTVHDEGRRGEEKPSAAGGQEVSVRRPPAEIEESSPGEIQHLAETLREHFFARLGLSFRDLSAQMGAGYTPTTLSRISKGTKVPSFEELEAILSFSEKAVGAPLPQQVRDEMRIRHLRAIRQSNQTAYDLYMAVEEVRAWRTRYSQNEGAAALLETRWRHAVLAQNQAEEQLQRTDSATKREAAAAHRALEAAHEERRTAQAHSLQMAAELHVVRDELKEQVRRLESEVTRLTAELQSAQEEQQRSWEERARVAERLTIAEQRAQVEQREHVQLEEHVTLLNQMLQQAKDERTQLQAQHEIRLQEYMVLADAEAAVEAARRLEARAAVSAAVADTGATPSATHVRSDDDLLQTAAVGSPSQVAQVVNRLVAQADPDGAREVLARAAERPGAEVVALVQALEEVGCYPQKELLLVSAAQQPAVTVAAAIRALHAVDRAAEVGWMLDAAARAEAKDVTSLTLELLGQGMRADAGRLLDAAPPRRSAREVADLVVVLVGAGWTGEAERLVKDAAVRRSGREMVELLRTLLVSEAAPFAEHITLVTAGRPVAAVVAAVQALAEAGETIVIGQVLEKVGGRTPSDVARIAAVLADKGCAQEADWLLDSRALGGVTGMLELLEQLHQDGRADLIGRLLDGPASSYPATETADLLLKLHGLPKEVYGAFTRSIAQRSPSDLLELVGVLGHRQQDDISAQVLQQIVLRPVAEAVSFLDELLDVASAHIADRLPHIVIGAELPLGHLLEVAGALRAAGWHSEAHELLRSAGAEQRISPSVLIEALGNAIYGTEIRQLLVGWSNRPADEIMPLVEELLRSGHGATAWFVLGHFVTESDAAGLAAALNFLREAGWHDDADRLIDQLVDDVEYSALADLSELMSAQDADTLLLRIAAYGDPGDVAAMLVALAATGSWWALIEVLQAAARCPGKRMLDVAVHLTGMHRPRQAAWLAAQGSRGGPRRKPSVPCGESANEGFEMAKSALEHDDPDLALRVLLESIRSFSTGEVIALLEVLDSGEPLLGFALHIADQSADAVPGLYPTAVSDICDLTYLLRQKLHLPKRADRVLEFAVQELSVESIATLMETLHQKNRRDDLAHVRNCAPRYLPQPHLIALAAEVLRFDVKAARSMMWKALRSDTSTDDLRELASFTIDSGLGTRAEVTDLINRHRPADVAAVFWIGPEAKGDAGADGTEADGRKRAPHHEGTAGAVEANSDTGDRVEAGLRPEPPVLFDQEAASEEFDPHAVDTRRLFLLWRRELENHPLLKGDQLLQAWIDGCRDPYEFLHHRAGEVSQALYLALLRLPSPDAHDLRLGLNAICHWLPATPWEIPAEAGGTFRLHPPGPASGVSLIMQRGKNSQSLLDPYLSSAVSDTLELISRDRTLRIISSSGQLLALRSGSGSTFLGGRRSAADAVHRAAQEAADVRGAAQIAHHVQVYGHLDQVLGSLVHQIPAAPDSWWGQRRSALLARLEIMIKPSGARTALGDATLAADGERVIWNVAPAIHHPGYKSRGTVMVIGPEGVKARSFSIDVLR